MTQDYIFNCLLSGIRIDFDLEDILAKELWYIIEKNIAAVEFLGR